MFKTLLAFLAIITLSFASYQQTGSKNLRKVGKKGGKRKGDKEQYDAKRADEKEQKRKERQQKAIKALKDAEQGSPPKDAPARTKTGKAEKYFDAQTGDQAAYQD